MINHEQQELFHAMLKYDGDRPKVAKSLGISISTLYRYFREYDMYPIIDRCGWKKREGAERGSRSNTGVARAMVASSLKNGVLDLGHITVQVYGSDTPALRGKMMAALEDMRRHGTIQLDEKTGAWHLTAAA